MMTDKDKLLDIIDHRGLCLKIYCDEKFHTSCPLEKICVRSGFFTKVENYRQAINVFVERYGKEDLVELLV
jgi:hypothetical protein